MKEQINTQPPCCCLQELLDQWKNCNKCELSKTRTNLVFGSGDPHAGLLIVGEGPGEKEDLKGLPFVGRSGKVIDQMFSFINRERRDGVFVTNIVCCRPTLEHKSNKGVFIENRPPNKEERESCKPRLLEQIYLIDPLIIMTLGKPATSALLGSSAKIGGLRGNLYTATIPGRHGPLFYPVMPIYHPAFLLRNPNYEKNGPWDLTIKDFAAVFSIINYLRDKYYGEKNTWVDQR